MNERIKKLRKTLDLTQQEFANRIGSVQNTITGYETGRRVPSGQVIALICKTFNVSETWLRAGEGEMFVQRSEEDELAAAVERLITGESAEFKRRLVSALSTLKDEHWLLLEQKLNEIVGARGAAQTNIAADRAELEREVDQEVERYRQQLLLEKERELQASSAYGSDAG